MLGRRFLPVAVGTVRNERLFNAVQHVCHPYVPRRPACTFLRTLPGITSPSTFTSSSTVTWYAVKVPTLSSPSAPSSARQYSTSSSTDCDGAAELDEADLDEQFVRGSGPGGQKINKSSVCVVLKHIPTGTIVRCQESRSQGKNREIARKMLRGKLDTMQRGKESEAAREASRERARKAKRRRKSVTKHFKSRRDRMLLDV